MYSTFGIGWHRVVLSLNVDLRFQFDDNSYEEMSDVTLYDTSDSATYIGQSIENGNLMQGYIGFIYEFFVHTEAMVGQSFPTATPSYSYLGDLLYELSLDQYFDKHGATH